MVWRGRAMAVTLWLVGSTFALALGIFTNACRQVPLAISHGRSRWQRRRFSA